MKKDLFLQKVLYKVTKPRLTRYQRPFPVPAHGQGEDNFSLY